LPALKWCQFHDILGKFWNPSSTVFLHEVWGSLASHS
jgi:hypothetical protein